MVLEQASRLVIACQRQPTHGLTQIFRRFLRSRPACLWPVLALLVGAVRTEAVDPYRASNIVMTSRWFFLNVAVCVEVMLALGAPAVTGIEKATAEAQYLFDNRYLDSTYTAKAWRLLGASRSLAPEDERAMALWCQVCLELGDDSQSNANKDHYYGLAEQAAETLRTRYPWDPAGHFWWAAAHGERMLVQGIPQAMLALPAVIREMELTLQLDSGFAFPYAVLGVLYRDLPAVVGGSYERSRSYFETGIRHAPNFTLLELELARLDAKEGRYSEARAGLENVLWTQNPLYESAYILNDRPEADSMLAAIRGL